MYALSACDTALAAGMLIYTTKFCERYWSLNFFAYEISTITVIQSLNLTTAAISFLLFSLISSKNESRFGQKSRVIRSLESVENADQTTQLELGGCYNMVVDCHTFLHHKMVEKWLSVVTLWRHLIILKYKRMSVQRNKRVGFCCKTHHSIVVLVVKRVPSVVQDFIQLFILPALLQRR